METMNMTQAKIMILNGEGVEHYEQWARMGDVGVKWELAKRGYCPEYFLDDDTPFVTAYALQPIRNICLTSSTRPKTIRFGPSTESSSTNGT